MAQWISQSISKEGNADITNNRSLVRVIVTLHWNTVSWSYNATYGSVNVDGASHGFTVPQANPGQSGSGSVQIYNNTFWITHNYDGTRYVSASASYNTTNSSGTVTASTGLTLPTIPRASNPTTNVPTQNIGADITIYTNRKSSSFTHTIKYSCGDENGTIGTGIATSKLWTIPTSLYNDLPNVTSKTLTITCDTYNGSVWIGASATTITITVAPNIKPIITSSVMTQTTTTIAEKYGFSYYIQNQSVVKIENLGNPGSGSSITTWENTIGGVIHTGQDTNNILLTKSGNNQKRGIRTMDARGRICDIPEQESYNVVPYQAPVLSNVMSLRCYSNGVINDQGTSVKLFFDSDITPLSNKNTKNAKAYWLNGSTWTPINTSITLSDYDESIAIVLDKTFSAATSGRIKIEIKDDFNTAAFEVPIPTAGTAINYQHYSSVNKYGIGIGKMSEKSALEVEMEAEFNDKTIHDGAVTFNDDIKLNPEGTAIEGLGNFSNMPLVVGSPIVESGNNANGDWIRYADGTQICYGRTEQSNPVGSEAYGSVYYRKISNTAFARAFTNQPRVFASPLAFNGLWYITVQSVRNITFDLHAVSQVNGGDPCVPCYLAIGKWK